MHYHYTGMCRSAIGLAAFQIVVWASPASGQTPSSTFNPGIYYRMPNLANPGARLARLEDPLLPEYEIPPVGWDMCKDDLVSTTPEGMTLTNASGRQRRVSPSGIFRMARPAFSPDCQFVTFQASATPDIVNGAEDLNIYVVEIATGGVLRVGDLPWNEESPRFFVVADPDPSRLPRLRLAYSAFSPTEGVNLHVFDLAERREVLRVRDIGALQIAISPDGTRLLDPRRMRIYRTDKGAVVEDLLQSLVAALPSTGYSLDERFKAEEGMPNKGLYPLDASFSPAGDELVLDWAVRAADGSYGDVLMRFVPATRALRAVTRLIPSNGDFTNHNNFSQLNPVWK